MKKYLFRQKKILGTAILLGGITSIGSALLSAYLGTVIDTALAGEVQKFFRQSAAVVALFLVYGLLYSIYGICAKQVTANVSTRLRTGLFRGILRRSKSEFQKVNSAEYLSMLGNDVKIIEENYLALLLSVIENMISFLACLFVMLYLSPVVTLALFVGMALLILVPALFQKSLQHRQGRYSEKLTAFTERAKDFLSGFEVIRSYNIYQKIEKEFTAANEEVRRSRNMLDIVTSIVEAVSATLGALVQCSVLFAACYLIIQGRMSAGTLVALVSVSGGISIPIQVISGNTAKMQSVKEVLDKLQNVIREEQTELSAAVSPSFEQGIEVKQVSFSYDGEKDVIQEAELQIEKGKKYALVGKSGCGKSTLVDLMTGSYENYQGEILYDGKSMKGMDSGKVVQLSSVIHQNVYMFNESIRDNIGLSEKFSGDSWQRAMRESGTALFAPDEQALGQSVGENGSKLSGGQRQRIAVARALIRRKPLLILDEGTSAIDKQTAYEIESVLLEKQDLTIVTVTHNLDPELLAKYDEIIYLEDGRIGEKGTFEALMEKGKGFRDFYHRKAEEAA